MLGLIFILSIVMLVGYVWNIVKLAKSPSLTGMDALRVVGIFIVPMGSVFGFC